MVIAVTFILHFYFPRREADITSVKKEMVIAEKTLDRLEKSIVAASLEFKDNQLPKRDFDALILEKIDSITLISAQHASHERDFKRLDSHYKSIYFGYPSRRSLIWVVGLCIIISVLSYRLMVKNLKTVNINEKKTDTALSFIGAVYGAYFVVWILDPVDRLDLPYQWYATLTVALSVLGAFLGFFLSNRKYQTIRGLKDKLAASQVLVESLLRFNREEQKKEEKV